MVAMRRYTAERARWEVNPPVVMVDTEGRQPPVQRLTVDQVYQQAQIQQQQAYIQYHIMNSSTSDDWETIVGNWKEDIRGGMGQQVWHHGRMIDKRLIVTEGL